MLNVCIMLYRNKFSALHHKLCEGRVFFPVLFTGVSLAPSKVLPIVDKACP